MGNSAYWCMLFLSKRNYLLTYYLCIHAPFTFAASSGAHDQYFIWLLLFCQYPVLNRGSFVKGQGFYPLGHSHWQLHGVFDIFYLPVLYLPVLLSPKIYKRQGPATPTLTWTFHQPCLMSISISSSSPSPVSDYIQVPDFGLNISCFHMDALTYLWFLSFLAFLTFLRDRFFSKLWQNPSAVLYQTSTTDPLAGGTSTFTPLLFRSLAVNCRWLVHEHMWGLPEMEITWWN